MTGHAAEPASTRTRAKLIDVARAAKVSLATASRALNQPAIVRPDVRERVLEAVRALAYTPDRNAKALSSGRSFTVGAVVPTIGNAIFADGIEALQDRLGEHGFTLLLSNSQYDTEKELGQIKAMLEHGVDGLVLVGDTFSPRALPLIAEHAVPCISTYVAASSHGLPVVGINNYQAGRDVAQHLLGLGHRAFGIIANTALPNDRSKARLRGILDTLRDAGCAPARGSIVEVPHPRIASGREALGQLIAAGLVPTAVLCTTDGLAVGALAEARHRGIAVPGALSVSGFDDVEIASEVVPPLTTVHVPAGRIGRLAADHIVAAIGGGDVPIATQFAARLIVRASTAAPRG